MTSSSGKMTQFNFVTVLCICSRLLLVDLCGGASLDAASIRQNCLKQNDKNETFQLVWNDEFDEEMVNEDEWLFEDHETDCLGTGDSLGWKCN